jgi:hypothetical protein
MTSKHPTTKRDQRPRSDHDIDPRIGTSKGTKSTGEDPRDRDRDCAFKGDVTKEKARTDDVDPGRTVRITK